MKIRHILLTTDLSEESLRAFDQAAALAKESGAKLTVLTVVMELSVAAHGAPLAPPISQPDIQEEIDEATKRLEEQLKRLPSGLDLHSEVISAPDIPRAIADYAEKHGADLIAISTHGRTGFRRMILGSVAEAVLRHSHVPVLCFPRSE